jgi:hypothetical protein
MAVGTRPFKLKDLLLLFLLGLGMRLAVYLLNGGKDLYDAFVETSINARVAVHGYNHDNPRITILNGVKKGRETTLVLFPRASHYLRTNDSIIKKSGTNIITIIRDSANYYIITHWTELRSGQYSSTEKKVTRS